MNKEKTIARECLKHIPSWSHLTLQDVTVTPVLGGCSRLLFKVQALPETEVSTVLFRLLNTASHLSDYKRESSFMINLSEQGITEGLFFMCARYRIEKFIDGAHLSKDDPLFSDEVLKVLAKMHSLKMSGNFHVISQMRTWLPQVLKLSPELEECHLQEEIDWVEDRMATENMMLGLVHSDLHRLNLLMKDDGSAMFCDFEYTGTNPIAYEFANSFFELSMDNGHEQPPYFKRIKEKYPSREKQLDICKRYFHHREMEVNLDQFLKHIQICTLASHLMWCLWATLAFDDVGENIQWGYQEYGRFRLKNYFDLKDVLQQ